jgi:hypothetical protein
MPQETEQRFSAWADNLRYIEEYNAKHSSHWVSAGCGKGQESFCSLIAEPSLIPAGRISSHNSQLQLCKTQGLSPAGVPGCEQGLCPSACGLVCN